MNLKRSITVLLLVFLSILFVSCSNAEENNEDAKGTTETSSSSGQVVINLYDSDRPDDLLDISQKHYEPIEGLDYDTVNYIDENIFISAGSTLDEYSKAVHLQTGENIWDHDTSVNIPSYLEAPIYQGELYHYTSVYESDGGKITLHTDPEKNEAETVDEETLNIYMNEFNSEDTAYVSEGDDEKTITAYDLGTLDEKWQLELPDFDSIFGTIVETGDYVFIETIEAGKYIVEKETGDIVYEDESDDIYYEDAILIGDKFYLVDVNEFTGDLFTIYTIDTNTWEREEIISDDAEHLDSTIVDHVELIHAADRLLMMYEESIYVIDLETEDIQNIFYYEDADAEGAFISSTTINAFIDQDKLYTLSDHAYHKTFNVIDIQTGEILSEYRLGDDGGEDNEYAPVQVLGGEYPIKVIEKISDDKFVIITREHGIYEFDFTDIE